MGHLPITNRPFTPVFRTLPTTGAKGQADGASCAYSMTLA